MIAAAGIGQIGDDFHFTAACGQAVLVQPHIFKLQIQGIDRLLDGGSYPVHHLILMYQRLFSKEPHGCLADEFTEIAHVLARMRMNNRKINQCSFVHETPD